MAKQHIRSSSSACFVRPSSVLIGSSEFASLEYVKELFCCSDTEQEEQEKPLVHQRASAKACDWSDLPRDISNLIADKISFFPHMHTFGGACTEWKNIIGEITTPERIKRDLPMLLLPYNEETHMCTFVEMKTWKMYDLKIPELEGRWICGSSNGWLAMNYNNLDLFLFNPFTRGCIKHRKAIPVIDYGSHLNNNNEICPKGYVHKVVLSGDPSSSNCLAAAIFNGYDTLAICRIEEDQWTVVQEYGFYDDIIFHRGKMFATTKYQVLIVIDYGGHGELSVTKTIPLPLPNENWLPIKKYLVLLGGRVLFISRFGKMCRDARRYEMQKTWRFEVYELNPEMEKLDRVDSLGEQSLFLGPNESISVSAKEFPSCRPNFIYFTHHTFHHNGYQWDNGVYSLEENRVVEKFDIQHSLSVWSASALWYQPSV